MIRLALCPPESGFPNCNSSRARNATLSIANGTAEVTISDLAPGSYAVSVFHDANANGRLDTFVGIPKEGYGFSRNPPFRPRAPRFSEAVIQVTENASTVINLRYLF